MANRKGVKSLLNDTYPNMKPTYRLIKVSESEKGEIGHINFSVAITGNYGKLS